MDIKPWASCEVFTGYNYCNCCVALLLLAFDWLVYSTVPTLYLTWTWSVQSGLVQSSKTLTYSKLIITWWGTADRGTKARLASAAPTHNARGNAGIWLQWLPERPRASGCFSHSRSGHIAILLHPPSLCPAYLWQATESCSHSNCQVRWCPWGSLLVRIPQCPLSANGRPFAEWLFIFADMYASVSSGCIHCLSVCSIHPQQLLSRPKTNL